MQKIDQQKLILASASPRRKDLLEKMGLVLGIYPADVDESRFQEAEPGDLVRILSLEKASFVSKKYPDFWILGADTLVVAGKDVLGKPESRQDAVNMLHCLSGTEHSVITGFTLIHEAEQIIKTRSVETRVRFKTLSEDEIFWYVHTDEPYDKAGGYGIQGKAAWMIESITGSYTNVMGLPLTEVSSLLLELGVMKFRNK